MLSQQHLLDEALEVMAQEYKNLPEGDSMISKLSEKLTATFTDPPVDDIEFLLSRRISPDNIRLFFFRPNSSHIDLYPILLKKPDEQIASLNIRKIQPLLLAFIYLIHRKNWSFMEQFILSGSLVVIVDLIGDDNLYNRGQAIEIMLAATDCDHHDWFVRATDQKTKSLHNSFLRLYSKTTFIQNLLKNRVNSYPGGSMRCLQILAFWLSWVRAEYTEDQCLLLSSCIIEEFRLWSLEEYTPDSTEEERELASTLLKDFGRVEAIDAGSATSAVSVHLQGLSIAAQEVLHETIIGNIKGDVEDSTSLFPNDPMNAAVKLKEEANAFFKAKQYSAALGIYDQALDILNTRLSSSEIDRELVSTLHFNKASTFWKLSQQVADVAVSEVLASELDLNSSISDKIYDLQRCEQACQATLAIIPSHIKAFFRLISVKLALGRPFEAIESLKAFVYDVNDKNTEKIISDLTRQCNAAVIVRKGLTTSTDADAITSSILSSGVRIDTRTAKILARLNVRRQRENENCPHAWRDWEPPIDAEAQIPSSSLLSEDVFIVEAPNVDRNPDVESIFQCLLDDDQRQPLISTLLPDDQIYSSGIRSEGEREERGREERGAGCGIPTSGLKKPKDKSTVKANSTSGAKSKKADFMRMMNSL